MARPKVKKRKDVSSAKLPSFAGASLSELGVLAELLPLLRSGALDSLLSAGNSEASSSSALPKHKAVAIKSVKEESGWTSVKKKNTSDAMSTPTPAASEALLPEGFSCDGYSVKVLQSVADIKVDEASVCLATRKEAEEAEFEINAQVPIALLIPSPRGEGCQLVHVAVKDSSGKRQVRRRFLFQLGKKPIRYMENAPQGGKVTVETEKIVLGVMQKISPCWEAALQNPKRLFGNWLRDFVGIPFVIEIQRPNLSGDKLQAVLVIRKGDRNKCLCASGKEGIFSRVFVEPSVEKAAAEFRTVPAPLGQDLASVLRTAESFKQHWGIVPYGKGVGIRVAANDFEATLAIVQPIKEAVKFLGQTFAVSGIPLSWSSEDLSIFFEGKWTMTPIFSQRIGFTKTWTVRSTAAPLHSHWQHDFGLAPVSEKTSSTGGSGRGSSNNKKEQRLVWSGRTITTKATQPVQKPPPPANAPAPAPARRAPARAPAPSATAVAQSQPEGALSAAALAAIQAAVAAALAPLQSKVDAMSLELQEMSRLQPGGETDSEEESEREGEAMQVDARGKRPLEGENSSMVTLRRSKTLERPARTQRT